MTLRSPLPIDAVLPDLVAKLRGQPAAVVRAPTGAGKTTRVPPALLDAGLAAGGRIVMLEPRRLAARAAARRMAAERGGSVGDEVGFQVRFERCAGPRTRILVVTPGILLRMLQDDPFLEQAGTIIFDEFHERGLDSDLALGMVRLVQQTVRPELRIVVMSATLEVETVSAYLGRCPVVTGEGRLYAVEVVYEPPPPHSPAVVQAVRRLLDRTPGDVLVFLPGLYEIRQAARQFEALAQERGLTVLPLHGDLPAEQQDAALQAQGRRRVVLATNVAETSVTVEGITGVVDTGLARMLVFDPAVGLDRLRVMPISRASADQRAGRAGRTQPGVCIRLWSEVAHRSRPEQTEPEIRRVDLAGAALQLLALGEKDVAHFPWLDPPREAAVTASMTLLRRLGAVMAEGVTELGRVLARLPVHPRLGRLLIEGERYGQVTRAALAAALLSERDPFPRTPGGRPGAGVGHVTQSDVLDRVEALEEHEHRGGANSELGLLNRGAARFVLRARDQLVRVVRQERGRIASGFEPSFPNSADEALLRSLLAAFPDRLARRRELGSRQGVMVGGRGVRLDPGSGVTGPELFLCIDVDNHPTEALVRQASAVQRDWLPADHLTVATEVAFDPAAERVTARKRLRFEDLVIEDNPAFLPDDDETGRVLAAAAAEHLERVRPPADSTADIYLKRLGCLRAWMPELGLPALGDAELRELLSWLCPGCRSFNDLRNGPWLEAVQGRLTHAQRQAVEREAPERLLVPSGSRLALKYEPGRPPVLAVRIQEVFGWRDTPRIAGGRICVLLHLLAPNHRPQQVTDDLASFWSNTYPQVRKELRARYPKHAWPEDPWTALPERRPRRKK